jgi:hypothetical protein
MSRLFEVRTNFLNVTAMGFGFGGLRAGFLLTNFNLFGIVQVCGDPVVVLNHLAAMKPVNLWKRNPEFSTVHTKTLNWERS